MKKEQDLGFCEIPETALLSMGDKYEKENYN